MITKLKKDSPDGRLASFLIDQRLISAEQLDKALEVLRASGGYLSEVLVNQGLMAEDDVAFALSQEFDVPLLSSQNGSLRPSDDQDLEKLISKQFALRNIILPLSREDNVFTCVMFNPLDVMLIDELRKITGCDVNTVVATKSDILRAIEEFYDTVALEKISSSTPRHKPSRAEICPGRGKILSASKACWRGQSSAPVESLWTSCSGRPSTNVPRTSTSSLSRTAFPSDIVWTETL